MLFKLFGKRVLVYTAFGNDDYFKIAAKLRNAGIKYSCRSPNVSWGRSRNDILDNMSRYYHYDFYVKKEEKHRALEVIHNKQF